MANDELDTDRDGWTEREGDASDERRGRFRRRFRGALMPAVIVLLVLTCAGLGAETLSLRARVARVEEPTTDPAVGEIQSRAELADQAIEVVAGAVGTQGAAIRTLRADLDALERSLYGVTSARVGATSISGLESQLRALESKVRALESCVDRLKDLVDSGSGGRYFFPC